MGLCYKEYVELGLKKIFYKKYVTAFIIGSICFYVLFHLGLPLFSIAIIYRAIYLPHYNLKINIIKYELQKEYRETKSKKEKDNIFEIFIYLRSSPPYHYYRILKIICRLALISIVFLSCPNNPFLIGLNNPELGFFYISSVGDPIWGAFTVLIVAILEHIGLYIITKN